MLEPEFSVTTASVDEVESAFFLCDGDRPLVVDLTALTFISSAGIRVLRKECLRGRPSALVVAKGSHVERVFDIAGVRKSVPIYHDLGTAMEISAVSEQPVRRPTTMKPQGSDAPNGLAHSRTIALLFPQGETEFWFTDRAFAVGDSITFHGQTWIVTSVGNFDHRDGNEAVTLRLDVEAQSA